MCLRGDSFRASAIYHCRSAGISGGERALWYAYVSTAAISAAGSLSRTVWRRRASFTMRIDAPVSSIVEPFTVHNGEKVHTFKRSNGGKLFYLTQSEKAMVTIGGKHYYTEQVKRS